jgi:dihydrolipoamide dehydrogenase
VEIIAGQARLVGPKTVEVNGQKLQAERAIVVATGAGWGVPPEGIDPAAITTPQQAMNLEPIPAQVLIWGGGPVELEFATLYACLGSKVALVIDGAYPLPTEDYDIGQRLQGALREQGIQMFTNATLKTAVKSGDEVKAVISTRKGETELTVQQLLWAGRRPNSAGFGLAEVGVKLDAAGAVVVNPAQQTSVPSIYAVGDVTGPPFYSSVATVEGLVAAENIMGWPRQLDRRLILRFAFTIPEVGCVGLTEEQAEDAGYEVEVINISMDTNSRATGLNETAGGIKIVANKKQGKILGVHIIGHRATELVAEAAMAVQLEALAEDWAWAIRVHPTLSESLVEAGRAVMKQALYIPPL